MQAVMQESGKRFLIDQQSDPVQLLTWTLNTLHRRGHIRYFIRPCSKRFDRDQNKTQSACSYP